MNEINKALKPKLLRPKTMNAIPGSAGAVTQNKGASAFLKPKKTTFELGTGMKSSTGGGLTKTGKATAGGAAAGGGVLEGIRRNRKQRQMGVSKRYDFSDKATKKDKQKYVGGAVAGTAAAGVGGGLQGWKAGENIAENRLGSWSRGANGKMAYKKPMGWTKSIALGEAQSLKSKQGAAGAALAATGIGGNAALDHKYKKSGKLVKVNTKKTVKKSHAESAFGVDHGGFL